jgi:hypothetical protein
VRGKAFIWSLGTDASTGVDGIHPVFGQQVYLTMAAAGYPSWMEGAVVTYSVLFMQDTGGSSADARLVITEYGDPSPRTTIPYGENPDDGVDASPTGDEICVAHYKHPSPAPYWDAAWDGDWCSWGSAYVYWTCAYSGEEYFTCPNVTTDSTTVTTDSTTHTTDEQ